MKIIIFICLFFLFCLSLEFDFVCKKNDSTNANKRDREKEIRNEYQSIDEKENKEMHSPRMIRFVIVIEKLNLKLDKMKIHFYF